MTRVEVLGITLLSVAALSGLSCAEESSATGGGDQRPPAVVETVPISQGAFEAEMRFVGRLQALSAAELYARTEGPIVAISAGSGDRIRKGQLLARIDASEAQQRVEQARAALRMAEATLVQRRSDLNVARTTAERSTRLFEQRLVSQSDHDVARAELATAAAQVELASAQIAQAQANLNGALLALEQTKIIAPFDGFIGKRHLDLGAYATTNRPVFSVVDLSTIRTTIPVPADVAGQIQRGQNATVIADALSGEVFAGRVSRISSVFDPQTDTVEAEVEIANEQGLLKPGMFATVRVAYRTDPSAFLVPASAIVRNDRESWIFIADHDPSSGLKARRVPVRASAADSRDDARVAVEALTGSLDEEMEVVILGQENLREGDPITTARNVPQGGTGQ